jgi:hypothetical protein
MQGDAGHCSLIASHFSGARRFPKFGLLVYNLPGLPSLVYAMRDTVDVTALLRIGLS